MASLLLWNYTFQIRNHSTNTSAFCDLPRSDQDDFGGASASSGVEGVNRISRLSPLPPGRRRQFYQTRPKVLDDGTNAGGACGLNEVRIA